MLVAGMPREPRTVDGDETQAVTVTGERRRWGASPAPQEIGRYQVLGVLGHGGMGVVYRARDPQLRREVALKVLHSDGRAAPSAAARLLREARAMAQLEHPNVVRVFDVGRRGDAVFLAMELIAGEDLRAFVGRGPHPWRAVLDVFCAAGRGLAAAHAVGLVHRDFKPANVIKGRDGAVRVLDFGLAWGPTHEDATDLAVSRPGNTAGTPAYMAPEQIRGAEVDARADQFAFCVSMWEALFGVRPFRGDTWPELAVSVLNDPPRVPAGAEAIPRGLVAALRRGLAKEPDARHRDMLALLAALDRLVAPRSRRTLPAVFVVGAAVGTLALARGSGDASECEAAVDPREVWSLQARAEVARRFTDAGAFGASAGPRVLRSMDAWVDAWMQARRDACATLDHDPAAVDRRLACLESRRRDLAITVDVLRTATGQALVTAEDAASNLPSIDACADDEELARGMSPADPADLARMEALTPDLGAIAAFLRVGKASDAAERIAAVAPRVAEVADPGFRAAFELKRGYVEEARGRFDAADQAYAQAFELAMEARDDEAALWAAGRLLFLHTEGLRRNDTAERWAAQAQALAARVEDPHALADLWSNLGTLRTNQGRFSEAIELHERALSLREASVGPDHASIAVSLNNLAVAKSRLGQLDEAEALHRRALASREAREGPVHPDVGYSLLNLGSVLYDAGRPDEALPIMERAVSVFTALYGPDDRRVGAALGNWAAALIGGGDDERARDILRRAHAILRRAVGDDHPETAEALARLGALLAREHRWAEAARLLEEALRVLERSYGDHPSVALVLNNLASCVCQLGRDDEGIALHRRALEMRVRMLPPGHPFVVISHANLGRALVKAGREAEGVAELDAALEIADASKTEVAPILASRARALARLGRAPEAVASAERALEILSDRGRPGADRREELETRFTLAQVLWDAGRLSEARGIVDALLEGYREDPVANAAAIEEIVAWRGGIGDDG